MGLYKLFFKKYDFVYVHYVAYSALPLLFRSFFYSTKIIVNFHGEDLLPRNFLEREILKIVSPIIYKADLIVVPSEYYRDLFISMYSRDNVFISASGGVDPLVFKPNLSNMNNDVFKIGFVSRIDPGKGWDLLLKSVDCWRDDFSNLEIQVDIIGSGSENDKLVEMIDQLNLQDIVSVIGIVDQKNLCGYYNSFDVFIFPTTLDESLGLVGLEAMACGIPVIGSSVGGIKSYLIDGYNGFLFEPGSVQGLKDSITRFYLMSNSSKKKLRSAAISTAENYSKATVSQELYNKVVSVVS